jgi:hypothetical protein
MKNTAEYPAIHGGDKCGAGVRGMQSPFLALFDAPSFKAGSFTHHSMLSVRCSPFDGPVKSRIFLFRHSGLDPESSYLNRFWIPAFAGMTILGLFTVSSPF